MVGKGVELGWGPSKGQVFFFFNGYSCTGSFETDINLIPRLGMSEGDMYVDCVYKWESCHFRDTPRDCTSPCESLVQ